jgi:hypothetical protein
MNARPLFRLITILGLAALAWLARSSTGSAVPHPTSPPAGASGPAALPAVTHPEIGFRDPSHLAEHFQKHGAEFGDITQAEYLRRAQALRDRPAGGPVREAVRRDGVVTRFDRTDGAFLAFDPDLTIRTYFRPNGGEAYFDRQLRRGRSIP